MVHLHSLTLLIAEVLKPNVLTKKSMADRFELKLVPSPIGLVMMVIVVEEALVVAVAWAGMVIDHIMVGSCGTNIFIVYIPFIIGFF